MSASRRAILQAALAGLGAPALIGRAWAAPGGEPLPVPPLLDADAAGVTTLTAIETSHRFVDGRASPTRGFDQPFLGPVLRLRRGSTARIDVRNRLDEVLTVHWHGLHVPGDVDGGPHQEIAPGGRWSVALEIEQHACTAWYHSHVHGRTGPHVNAGLAGLLIVDDPAAAGLPSRWGVDDLPLIMQDRRLGRDGRLVYSNAGPALMAGFRGDLMLVNGAHRPLARVPSALVRLRLLNGCNARTLELRFEDGRPMQQIASDAGLFAVPVARTSLALASGERAEVLVDFAAGGRSARLLSAADRNSPMGRMMGGGMGGMMGMIDPPAVAADGAFEVLGFEVDATLPAGLRTLPDRIVGAAPLPDFGEPVRRRRFVLDGHMGMMGGGMGRMGRGMGRGMGGMGGGGMMGGMSINGRAFEMHRIDERVRRGDTEIWQVVTSDMAHPFHVHGTAFQVLSRNGRRQPFAELGWKDTVLVDGEAELLLRFAHRASERTPYMFHCHILEHEDAGMMGQFTVA